VSALAFVPNGMPNTMGICLELGKIKFWPAGNRWRTIKDQCHSASQNSRYCPRIARAAEPVVSGHVVTERKASVTTILGVSGSLRRGFRNSELLRIAAEFMPEGGTLEIGRIDGVPLCNGDLESKQGLPL
jgi:MinD superfamily P-loop ATPase